MSVLPAKPSSPGCWSTVGPDVAKQLRLPATDQCGGRDLNPQEPFRTRGYSARFQVGCVYQFRHHRKQKDDEDAPLPDRVLVVLICGGPLATMRTPIRHLCRYMKTLRVGLVSPEAHLSRRQTDGCALGAGSFFGPMPSVSRNGDQPRSCTVPAYPQVSTGTRCFG